VSGLEEVLAEGYLGSRVGGGTFVAASLPDSLSRPVGRTVPGRRTPSPRSRLVSHRARMLIQDQAGPWFRGPGAFNVGQPPVDRFPLKAWSSLVAHHARRENPELLHYRQSMGFPALREQIALYLRAARAVRCEAEQIMIA